MRVIFRLRTWLVAIGLTAVIFPVLLSQLTGNTRSPARFARTNAMQLMTARLVAAEAGIDDRDLAALLRENYISDSLLSALIAPLDPTSVRWAKRAPGDWPPVLLSAGGEPPVIPAAPDPYRLGALIVLLYPSGFDGRIWCHVLLDVPGRSSDFLIVGLDRSTKLLPKRSWDAALAEQNEVRAAQGLPPIGDLRMLPDLLDARQNR